MEGYRSLKAILEYDLEFHSNAGDLKYHPIMEELFDIFDRKFPGFKNQIIGASDEEIRELEELVARSLPADYLSFLRLAGHGIFSKAMVFPG